MDFETIQKFSTLGVESAGCLLLIVISYKIFKMKIHTRSKCCGFLAETLNRGGSSSNLDFTPEPQEMKDRDDRAKDKNNMAII
tara:strand:- start:2326 stop:2574 length:249 start_codon:yes stop_codon:yes gene_type:complete